MKSYHFFTNKQQSHNQTININDIKRTCKKNAILCEGIKGNCLPHYIFDFVFDTKIEVTENIIPLYITTYNMIYTKLEEEYSSMGKIMIFFANEEEKKNGHALYKVSYYAILRGYGYFRQGSDIPKYMHVDGCNPSIYKNHGVIQKIKFPYCKKVENDTKIFKRCEVVNGEFIVYPMDKLPNNEKLRHYIIQDISKENDIIGFDEINDINEISDNDELDSVKIDNHQEENLSCNNNNFIEDINQEEDDIIESLARLFHTWHPNAFTVPKQLKKDNDIVLIFKNSSLDKCKICNQNHASDSQYLIYHKKNREGYYHCYNKHDSDNKIQIFGKRYNDLKSTDQPFSSNIEYYFVDLLNDLSKIVNKKDYIKYKNKIKQCFACILTSTGDEYIIKNSSDNIFMGRPSIPDIFKKHWNIIKKNNELVKAVTYTDIIIDPYNRHRESNKFNIWEPFVANRVKYNKYDKKLQLVLGAIKELWACNNDEVYNQIIHMLAFMVQNPDILYNKCLVLIGEHEVSRNILLKFLTKYVIGNHHTISYNMFKYAKNRNFNRAIGKRLCIVEELCTNERNLLRIFNALKTYMSYEKCPYTSRSKNNIHVNNINCWILTSDYMLDIPSEKLDNDFILLRISNAYVNDTEYFENLVQRCFNQKTGNKFFSYLMTIDLHTVKGSSKDITCKKY
jgi:hypothetical protein